MLRIGLAIQRPLLALGVETALVQAGLTVQPYPTQEAQLIREIRQKPPEILMIDPDQFRPDIVLIGKLLRSARSRVIAIIRPEQSGLIPSLFRTGIHGCLFDCCATDQLSRAIEVVRTGNVFCSPLVAEWMQRHSAGGNPQDTTAEARNLSAVEEKVAALLASDLRNKEIAERLMIKTRTVEIHRAAIMRKLQVRTAAGIVRFAVLSGLMDAS